jgi:hypothetical protein
MTDLEREDLLGRAATAEADAYEGEHKGELGSPLRRAGERMAATYREGARLYRMAATGDESARRKADELLEGGDYFAVDPNDVVV